MQFKLWGVMWIKENSKTFYIHSRHRVSRKVRGFLYSWRIIAWFERDNIVRICQSETGPLDTRRLDHVVHERSYQLFNKVTVYGHSQVGWEMKLWSERWQETDLSPCLSFWLFCKIHDIFSCSPICWPFPSDFFFLLFFSLSVVSDSLWPHGLQHARFPCPSLSPGVCSNLYPLSQWCHPTISSSVSPFACPQSSSVSI